MKTFLCILIAAILVAGPTHLNAQANTYILNGNATQNTCNCYTLTPAASGQSGSVWNANKISLNNSFDFIFNIFLGCADANGADGMVFMLQPLSTNVGTSGEGMGFEGVAPSIGISLDTWQNANRNDPAFDHINIQANGIITHGTDLAGPIQASATNANIEDCQWHTLRITWDPATRSLRTFFDGVFRLETTIDLIANIFNNDPLVYWGFSAGTGGSSNLQQFCTALNPDFTTNGVANSACIGTPLTFTSSSQSFSAIADYYWDFGDGTTSTLANPPPHVYAATGIYEVKMVITAMDGCRSDTLRRMVTIGDFPVASFLIADTCAGSPPRITDQSTVAVGTINEWEWRLDGNPVSVSQQPNLGILATGPYQLQLIATSTIGCASLPFTQSFNMLHIPVIAGQADDGCINLPVSFSGQQLNNAIMIQSWNWDFGDNASSSLQNPVHTYSGAGNFPVVLTATGDNGCISAPVTIPLFINQAVANAGNDTIAIQQTPFQLNGTGGVQYSWSPPGLLDNPSVSNPVGLFQDDITLTLTVSTIEGCTDTDDINITVFKGSAIYVPTGFTPNNDGLNDRIRPYLVGIQSLAVFSVYNRWGQLVFSTKEMQHGWDGTLKGVAQPAGNYTWLLSATDYAGKSYQLKGNFILIR